MVIEIDAVSDAIETLLITKAFHHSKEFVFAVEAALAIIAGVFGTIEFGSCNHLHRNVLLISKRERIEKMSAGQAGGIRYHRKHTIPEYLMSDIGQVSGVDSAGVRNQCTTKRKENSFQ